MPAKSLPGCIPGHLAACQLQLLGLGSSAAHSTDLILQQPGCQMHLLSGCRHGASASRTVIASNSMCLMPLHPGVLQERRLMSLQATSDSELPCIEVLFHASQSDHRLSTKARLPAMIVQPRKSLLQSHHAPGNLTMHRLPSSKFGIQPYQPASDVDHVQAHTCGSCMPAEASLSHCSLC